VPKTRLPAAGLVLLAVYIGSVVAANYLTARYGLVPVGLGLMATAGTAAIGGAILVRDLLQDTLGRVGVLAAITAAAVLSYAVASPGLALASGVTFLVAEGLEMVVYTPLRARCSFGSGRWAGTVAVANVTGALLDTLLFLHLAGFPVTGPGVGGQMLGKAYVTVAVVALVLAVRRSPARA
jgi:hypothetical protein